MFERFKEDLRQWTYSREFRIEAPRWCDLSSTLALEDVMKLLKAARTETPPVSDADKSLVQLAAGTGTTFWRLQKRIAGGKAASDEMKRAARDLEAMGDALRDAGIEIKDHTSEKFDSGMALRVIAFQPTAGIIHEVVIETIKPTIYKNNQLVQMGEVIVGVPESKNPEARA